MRKPYAGMSRCVNTYREVDEASGIARNYRKNLSSFSTSIEFRDDNGSFYFGKTYRARVNTKNDRYLSLSGRTRTSDTFDVVETCFLRNRFGTLRKSSIEITTLTTERSRTGCFQYVHVRLLSAPLFTNFPSLFATVRYQSRTSVPALVSQSFCKAIKQTRELRSQIYNFHSRCVCLCALVESLCDCSRVQ